MNGFNEHIEALIALHFSGEITALQEAELQEWRDADPENEVYFRDMEFVYFASASITEVKTFDVDKAWNKVAPAELRSKPKTFHIGNRTVWSIAASFILIALLAYLLLFRDGSPEKMEYAAAEVSAGFTLPDRSQVHLEPGSRLVALSDDPLAREYALEGKGRFTVEHSETNPFVLHSGEVRILDLGTEFTVDARPGNDTVFVEVFEGKVQFATETQKGEELLPEQQAYYLRSAGTFTRYEKESKATLFGSFDFQGQRLADVVSMLNGHFSSQIVLSNPVLADCKINVNFKEESLADILEILALTLQLQIEEKENVIELKGNGCN